MKAAPARPAFWVGLLLVLLASSAMKLLAHYTKQDRDPDIRIALYLYPSDAMPDCAQLLGRTATPGSADEIGALWVRLPLPPVTEIATGACRVSARITI